MSASPIKRILIEEDETRYLLALKPTEAIVRMFNLVNGTQYPFDYFTVSAPVPLGSTLTQVTLTRRPSASSLDSLGKALSFDFTYHRVDVQNYLGDLFKDWEPTETVSTQEVLDVITQARGQAFYPDDFVFGLIFTGEGDPHYIRAKEESLRWYGIGMLGDAPGGDLSDLFEDGESVIVTPEPTLFPPQSTYPFINFSTNTGVDPKDVIKAGDKIQDQPLFAGLINLLAGDPLKEGEITFDEPWHISEEPSSFNLYNAKVVEFGSGEGINYAAPELPSSIVIAIDPTYCTNFKKGTLILPYGTPVSEDFSLTPRVAQSTSLSLSDGTAFNEYLASWKKGETLSQTSQSIPDDFTIDGDVAWVCNADELSPTNLEGARILYNGPVAGYPSQSEVKGLTQVAVIEPSGLNSVWKGPYRFHYAPPTVLTTTEFVTPLGRVPNVDFEPLIGYPGFSYRIQDTSKLPPGTALVGHALEGVTTQKGTYTYVLQITDTNRVSVSFTLTHRVVDPVEDLELVGVLPDALEGAAYMATLSVKGGLPPYGTPTIRSGYLPDTVSLSLSGTRVRLDGVWNNTGTREFTLEVTSSDGQSYRETYQVTTQPKTPLTLQIIGNFDDGIVGEPYESRLEILGGRQPYFQLEFTGDAVIPGLTFSLEDNHIVLKGTPAVEDTHHFTVKVRSNDGQTALVNVDFVLYKLAG